MAATAEEPTKRAQAEVIDTRIGKLSLGCPEA